MPATDGCPWEQCGHRYNAHAKDHCLACECEKPPPPLPGAPSEKLASRLITSEECTTFGPLVVEEFEVHGEPQELEALEMDVCNVCSAYVTDRERHVTWHERMLDTVTNLVMSIAALERRFYAEEATRRAEQADSKGD